MTTMRFNAITYANKLRNAGATKELADIQAEELDNIVNNDLVNKRDLKELEMLIKKDMLELELKLTKSINEGAWKTIGFIASFQIVTLGLFTFIQHFWG